MTKTITETNIGSLSLLKRGKVRDIYDLGSEILIVATDRISCFDVVLPTPIPEKGKILTELSHFWMDKTRGIIPNQLSSKKIEEFVSDSKEIAILKERSTIAKKTAPLPLEAIVRGYISGSAWEEYKNHGTVCGQKLPPGLTESHKLSEPLFTPSTKADIGKHDENIPFSKLVDLIGKELAEKVKTVSIRIYNEAAAFALKRGIIIADTKMELGILNDELILIDELLTPDSSRFWPSANYVEGKAQPSFDKQFVRDYLISTGWNKKPPAPELPEDVVEQTTKKYREALKKITSVS